jgi:transposase
VKVDINKIKFLDESYPRESLDSETVNAYRMNLDNLPPIVLTKDLFLVDGYHRLTAHKMSNKLDIEAEEILLDIKEADVFTESIKRNAFHGKPFTMSEKRKAARRLFESDHKTVDDLVPLLGVEKSTIYEWVNDIRQAQNTERDKKILDLYLACYTQEEIAEKIKVSQKTVSNRLQDMISKISTNGKITRPDSLQCYNVWNFPRCNESYGMKGYTGRIPGQIIENLLYYYTEPFDIVVDPMGGSGTTIDVCKAMYRRHLTSDIKPIRVDIIDRNIIANGFLPKAKGCKLVFLDPPYWRLKESDYQTGLESYKQWCEFMAIIAASSAALFSKGQSGIVALLVEAFFDRQNGKQFVDLPFDCSQLFIDQGFKVIQRISAPLPVSTVDINDQKYGETNKILLDLNRDLILFSK